MELNLEMKASFISSLYLSLLGNKIFNLFFCSNVFQSCQYDGKLTPFHQLLSVKHENLAVTHSG